MRKDVHLAALRAAGKVAFSMAFIAGCSSAGEAETGDPTASDEALSHGHADAGACTAKFTCDDLVKAAFPTEGQYPGKKVAVTPKVASCCHDLLASSHGFMANRWDCCANYAEGDGGEGIGMACTPWGPPVPPPMKRRSAQVA